MSHPEEEIRPDAGRLSPGSLESAAGVAAGPRVARRDLTEWLTLKAGAGLYSSPPPFNDGEQTQKFGNPELGFQQSRQYMAGAIARLNASTSLDVQAYYKDLSNLVIPYTPAKGAGIDLPPQQPAGTAYPMPFAVVVRDGRGGEAWQVRLLAVARP